MNLGVWRLCVVLAAIAGLTLSAQAAAAPNYRVVIDITLSPRAASFLKAHHEGIDILVNYWGEPVPAKMSENTPQGGVGIGTEDVTTPGVAGRVVITGDKVIRERVSWVTSILVDISVASARRSSKNNLLACDIYDKTLAEAQRHPIPIHCRLLAEEYPDLPPQ